MCCSTYKVSGRRNVIAFRNDTVEELNSAILDRLPGNIDEFVGNTFLDHETFDNDNRLSS